VRQSDPAGVQQCEVDRKNKVDNRNRIPIIEDERVPTGDELRQIFNYVRERGDAP